MSILAGKAVWLVGLVFLCVGLVVGLSFGSTVEDADAARRRLLKSLWAVIQDDGLTTSYKGLTGNTRIEEGTYDISFNRVISKCAYTATASGGSSGDISTFNSGPRTVRVLTLTNDGNAYEDTPFHLVVNC